MRVIVQPFAVRRATAAVLLAALFALVSGLVPIQSAAERPRVPKAQADPELPPLTEAPPEPDPELPPLTEAPPEPSPEPEPTASPEPTAAPEPTATPAPAPAPAREEAAAPAAAAIAQPAAPAAVPAQAVSVCHYTGSNAAPYVLVQAPPDGGEHAAHGDDIIPAPAGGCPATYQGTQPPRPTPTPTPTPEPEPEPSGEVTLCHATGDSSRPYVELTVLRNRVREHERHRRDIVPAPEGGCPTRVVSDQEDVVPTPTPTPSPDDEGPDEPELPEPAAPAPTATAAPAQAAPPADPAPVTEAIPGLAHTGQRSGLAIIFGLGLMSSGAGLRLLSPAGRL
jgi:hypothetical protein